MELSGVTGDRVDARRRGLHLSSPFRRNAGSFTYDAPMAQLVIDEHPASHRHLLGRLCPTEKFATRLHNQQALSPAS
jgi:hypothetical protein